MNIKEKLYYLLREYLKGNYNCEDFSNLFCCTYYRELEKASLLSIEKKEFEELAFMTERFSDIEEDLKLPNVYFDENQIKTKVIDVVRKLKLGI